MKKFTLLFVLILSSCLSEDKIDASKYPILTTVKEVSDIYEVNLDLSGKSETCSVHKYFDGSVELEYTYDLIDTDRYTPLYYSIIISKERSVREAKKAYQLTNGAYDIVTSSFGQGTEEVKNINLPGDDNFYAIRTYDGEPNGVLLTIRHGKYIYNLITSGIYTDDHSFIKEVILPEIENLKKFSIVE
ncbi:hypothetical protein CLV91_1616 [Maribacter vaceletii]|uniref:Gliding motility-associated lipoprotein GldD n=1 Tax=Maribacter vaceletii TaxID=1206816 RepID=A0A495E7K6_9FLAO|nr:hypothetical protein [Maribacter vaceletii]RKR12904.1 hypothetical protein CLV91_1616 [Maribacter vaceletii]